MKGLILAVSVSRWTPSGTFIRMDDFLIGYGTIHYFVPPQPGYNGENAAPRSYGGGIDFDVARSFQVRVDYQSQHWNFGEGNVISPTTVMFGVRYVLPFRPYVSLRDQ
jgi:hypothetical protein